MSVLVLSETNRGRWACATEVPLFSAALVSTIGYASNIIRHPQGVHKSAAEIAELGEIIQILRAELAHYRAVSTSPVDTRAMLD